MRTYQQINMLVSVLPKTNGVCNQIDEEHSLQNDIAKLLHEKGYKYVIAGEDMMSDVAKDKIQDVSAAHWIFSGNSEDYDGYYINCSLCGTQRKAYDRDNELDIPAACPHCGVSINREAWEVHAQVRERKPDLFNTLYRVFVVYDDGKVARPYVMTTRAKTEAEAQEKAITDVLVNWLHKPDAVKDVFVESVEVIG